jgi:hypothetical protein
MVHPLASMLQVSATACSYLRCMGHSRPFSCAMHSRLGQANSVRVCLRVLSCDRLILTCGARFLESLCAYAVRAQVLLVLLLVRGLRVCMCVEWLFIKSQLLVHGVFSVGHFTSLCLIQNQRRAKRAILPF